MLPSLASADTCAWVTNTSCRDIGSDCELNNQCAAVNGQQKSFLIENFSTAKCCCCPDDVKGCCLYSQNNNGQPAVHARTTDRATCYGMSGWATIINFYEHEQARYDTCSGSLKTEGDKTMASGNDDSVAGCCQYKSNGVTNTVATNKTGCRDVKGEAWASDVIFYRGLTAYNNECISGCCKTKYPIAPMPSGGAVWIFKDYSVGVKSDSFCKIMNWLTWPIVDIRNTIKGEWNFIATYHEGFVPTADNDCVPSAAYNKNNPNSAVAIKEGAVGRINNISQSYKMFTNPLGTTDLAVIIGRVVKALLSIIGTIALVVIIFGGFTWLTAAGNPTKVKAGSQMMIWAAIGLIIALTAYVIVKYVFEALGA